MKVKFDTVLTNLKGEPLKDGKDDLTAASAIGTAMLATMPDDTSLTSKDKMRMFRLAQVACQGGVQEVPVEDVAFIKERVGKLYGPLVVGRVFELLGD